MPTYIEARSKPVHVDLNNESKTTVLTRPNVNGNTGNLSETTNIDQRTDQREMYTNGKPTAEARKKLLAIKPRKQENIIYER